MADNIPYILNLGSFDGVELNLFHPLPIIKETHIITLMRPLIINLLIIF